MDTAESNQLLNEMGQTDGLTGRSYTRKKLRISISSARDNNHVPFASIHT